MFNHVDCSPFFVSSERILLNNTTPDLFPLAPNGFVEIVCGRVQAGRVEGGRVCTDCMESINAHLGETMYYARVNDGIHNSKYTRWFGDPIELVDYLEDEGWVSDTFKNEMIAGLVVWSQ